MNPIIYYPFSVFTTLFLFYCYDTSFITLDWSLYGVVHNSIELFTKSQKLQRGRTDTRFSKCEGVSKSMCSSPHEKLLWLKEGNSIQNY